MGIWGVSKQELVEQLTDCLDNIEGDFNINTLVESLEFLKWYCPTLDSPKSSERIWRKKLNDLLRGKDEN